jgi:NitT/TauT family transport system ATP-binding protein
MAILTYDHASKSFRGRGGEVQALADFTLEVDPREFVAIVGPSGCGKSTLLNLTVGLLEPTTGAIDYKGERVEGVNTEIGYITQEDNLYPWRTLQQNVEFAMEVRGWDRDRRRDVAGELIDRVGLGGFNDHFRHELSGGMRQRGHIARTLAYEPEVILMDEPFGPLDVQTRLHSQQLLLDLWTERELTIVFITHDLIEAIALADRVVVLSRGPGRVKAVHDVDIARPRDVFELPTDTTFRALHDEIWQTLAAEMRGLGEPDADEVDARGVGAKTTGGG